MVSVGSIYHMGILRKHKKDGVSIGPLPCGAYRAGADTVHLYSTHPSDTKYIGTLNRELFSVLQKLRGFKNPKEHEEELARDEKPAALIRSAIKTLQSRGLLVRKDEFLEQIKDPSDSSEAPKIASICWPTYKRPAALARSLAGAVRSTLPYGRMPLFRIFDDTPEEDRHLIKIVHTVGRDKKLPIYYSGAGEKLRYSAALSRQAHLNGEEKELLSFLLFGDQSMPNNLGGNRNAIYLATAGELALTCDDDTLFFFTTPSQEHGAHLKIHSFERFLHTEHYTHLGEALHSHRLGKVDILAEHEKYLGKKLSAILGNTAPAHTDLGALDPETAGLLLEHTATPLRVTHPGILGDSGLPHNHIILGSSSLFSALKEGESEQFRTALKSRHLRRFTDTPLLSRNSHFQLTHIGMDNREFLPPLFPGGNGEDGLFAALFFYIFRGGFIGYLPFEFIHAPMPNRPYYSEGLTDINTRMNDHIIRLVSSRYRESAFLPGLPEDTLADLGHYFISLSRLHTTSFSELLRETNVSFFSAYLQFIESRYAAIADYPEYVEKAYNSHFDAVEDYLLSSSITEISDLRAPSDKKIETFKELIGRYGRALLLWPSLHHGAVELKNNGFEMGRPL